MTVDIVRSVHSGPFPRPKPISFPSPLGLVTYHSHGTPQVGYQGIDQHFYGLLGPETPSSVRGLCTSSVLTCLAFVVHCSTTKRSALTHTPSGVDWTAFTEQLLWVIDDRSKPAGNKQHVDVVVLKGASYATADIERSSGLPATMAEMSRELHRLAAALDINLTIHEHSAPLSVGSVVLERETGVIKIMALPSGVPQPALLHLLGTAGSMTNFNQTLVLIEVAIILWVERKGVRLWKQFDGRQEVNSLRLGPVARALLNQHNRLHTEATRDSFVRLATREGKRAPSTAEVVGFGQLMDAVKVRGDWCEICWSTRAVKKCGGCHGVSYCGSSHQKADWKQHKEWCRQHARR